MTPDRFPKQAAVRACQRCGQAWPPGTLKTPPWCAACEKAHLQCVTMMVLRDRDVWRVEFWLCNRAQQLGRTRRYRLEEPLYNIVLRAYDPALALVRLGWLLHRTEPSRGSVDLRLTVEQVQALQR